MKFFSLTLTLLALSCLSFASAGEVEFPKSGDAMFRITLPEGWEVESEDEDIIEAESPKENLTITIWEIDSEMTVEKLTKDLKNILRDYATNVKLEAEPKQIEVDGLAGILIAGRGEDEEDSHEVGFIALVLVKGDDASIIFFEMDGNITPGEEKKFQQIIKSISAVE